MGCLYFLTYKTPVWQNAWQNTQPGPNMFLRASGLLITCCRLMFIRTCISRARSRSNTIPIPRFHLRKMSADTQSPLPRRTVSVAIIGAGVAGLRAAEVLLNANNKGDTNVEYHVTVFEARNRIGGRVATSDGVEGWSGVGKAVDLYSLPSSYLR